ncbi:hypothetical protein [Glaesserella sp.]|uniref:hypothetical protein n=1 Tax=Glaesserella sp. TaxID=2094731 RepID=UPI00359F7766
MKRLIALGTVLALSVSFTVEAKGMKARKSYPATTQSKSQPKQEDATFENTPNANKATATVQPAAGNRMNNLVTGVAAGYLLNEMLTPEAQAQQPTQALPPAEGQTALPTIPSFKAIEPQADPYLIEKTPGYSRYCLNGIQYLISAANTQLPPTVMVDKNNAPMQCVIAP